MTSHTSCMCRALVTQYLFLNILMQVNINPPAPTSSPGVLTLGGGSIEVKNITSRIKKQYLKLMDNMHKCPKSY